MSDFSKKALLSGLLLLFIKDSNLMDTIRSAQFKEVDRINYSFLESFFKGTLCFYDKKIWFNNNTEGWYRYGYTIDEIYNLVEIAFDDSITIENSYDTNYQNLKRMFVEFLETKPLHNAKEKQQYCLVLSRYCYEQEIVLTCETIETALNINDNCYHLKKALKNKDYEIFKNFYFKPFSVHDYCQEYRESISLSQKKQKNCISLPAIFRNICNF